MSGQINRWRLVEGGDNLRQRPFFTRTRESPPFNLLFAGLYDLIFGSLTRMGVLVPDGSRTIRDIFLEKVYGSDSHFLVSAETIAYLKWLIYIAAFKDKSNLDHGSFYETELAALQHPGNLLWRKGLLVSLEEWYAKHRAGRGKRRRSGRAPAPTVEVNDSMILDGLDQFAGDEDILELVGEAAAARAGAGPGLAAGVALAAAAAAAMADGGGA